MAGFSSAGFSSPASLSCAGLGRAEEILLVRKETSPEDVAGMHLAKGILTSTGGKASHAAVVARGWGRCCVVGAGALHIDEKGKKLTIGKTTAAGLGLELGDAVKSFDCSQCGEVKVEGEGTHDVFEGQLSGFQPKFDTHLPVTTHVRGMNALAKLGRQRKTRTFKERTLKQIVEEIAGDNGLSVEFGRPAPTLRYEHLYQNNQTDLEYLRWLASRTCREVYCEGKKLLFRTRQKDEGPVSKLSWTEEGVGKALESFTPEFATAGQTKKITCRHWDPNKKKELVSTANASGSKLGGELGSNSESAGENVDFHDKPFYSQEEGDLLAKSLLEERQMNFITAEATCLGDGQLKPGMVIEIDTQDDRFDGNYYIAGVHFHFSHSSSGLGGGAGMGGFRCKLKLKRDAGKGGG